MMEWVDEQETNNLTPYNGQISEEAYRRICEQENPEYAASGFKSGETWWKRFKTKLSARTHQLAESKRAHGRLTEEGWLNFFNDTVRQAMDEVGGYPEHMFNMDKSPFRIAFLGGNGTRVYARKGSKKCTRK